MERYPTKINTTIPGLDVMFGKSGSYLYATVLHKESNLIAIRFNNEPLPCGMREFVRRLDDSELRQIDWTVPAEKLTDPGLFDLAMRVKCQVMTPPMA